MKTGFVSPIEYLFNVVLLAQWAMFLWYTLTPHWSKKTTILCFLPICLIAPVVATIFPSRSIARLLSVPVIMIAAAFLCFRSRPTRTVFCTIIPEMAIILAEFLIILVFPTISQNDYDSSLTWLNINNVTAGLLLSASLQPDDLVRGFLSRQDALPAHRAAMAHLFVLPAVADTGNELYS